jgi:hypothetical protein
MPDEQTQATPEEVESQPAGNPSDTGNGQVPPPPDVQAQGVPQPVDQLASQPTTPPDPLANHPAVQQASLMRKVGETIAGGPRVKTTIDPNTGTVSREQVPLSTGEIIKSALANILGGLSQMGNAYVASRQHRAAPAPQPLPTQVAAQQQAQQSQEDFERQQSQKVRQAKVLQANFEALRSAYAAGKEDDEAKDSIIQNHADDLDQWNKSGAVEASNVPSNELMQKGFDKTKYVAIPDGKVPVFGADGKRVTDSNGVPLSQFTYSVVDGTTQAPLTQEKYDQFAKYGLMKAKEGFNLPEGATITSATLAMMNHKLDLIQQTQRELDDVHEQTGGEKVDLAAKIKQDPTILSAIEKFHNDAASADPNDQIKSIQKNHPQAAGKMAELFGADNLKKLQDKKAADLAGAKTGAETAARLAAEAKTPEGQQKLENEKLTGEKDRLQIEDLKKKSEGFDAGDTSLTGEAYLNTLPAGSQSLVKELGTGKIALSRLDYLLTRKPEVLEAVSRAYPDFDSSKVQAYTNAVKEYTSTKNGTAGAQLNAGSTALKHMNELKELNTLESRIPGTKDYNRYNNKLDTLTGELATFYNLPKTDKSIQSMASTLGAFANRDAAITTQAQSMGDKFDSLEQTWKNAAPSKAYEAPMPYIDSVALKARAKLDPRYAARVSGQQPPPKTAPTQNQLPSKDKQTVLQSITLPGGGHPADVKYGPNGSMIVWSGKAGEGWIDPATGKAPAQTAAQ